MLTLRSCYTGDILCYYHPCFLTTYLCARQFLANATVDDVITLLRESVLYAEVGPVRTCAAAYYIYLFVKHFCLLLDITCSIDNILNILHRFCVPQVYLNREIQFLHAVKKPAIAWTSGCTATAYPFGHRATLHRVMHSQHVALYKDI